MDAQDKQIINTLQNGFPLSHRPFAELAQQMDMPEEAILKRIIDLKSAGILSRFGPLFNAEAMGGAFCLCAMQLDDDEFESVAQIVNGFSEVAHNYQRRHRLNMWFVLATESEQEIVPMQQKITAATGKTVYMMPKQKEFYVKLHLQA